MVGYRPGFSERGANTVFEAFTPACMYIFETETVFACVGFFQVKIEQKSDRVSELIMRLES